jgi:flagellar protein FlbD
VITLSRLNGSTVAINPDLITWIDVTPDTTVSLLTRDVIIVRESLDEVIERIVAFRKATGSPTFALAPRAMDQLHANSETMSTTRLASRYPPPRGNPPPRTTPPSRGNPPDRT